MKTLKSLIVVASLLISSNAIADKIVDGCAKVITGGEICPIDPHGTVVIDALGNAKCAPGMCVIDALGNAICSSRSGGRIVLNFLNAPSCQGGCIQPTRNQCEQLGY